MYEMELRLYGSRQLIEGQRGGGHQLTDLYVIVFMIKVTDQVGNGMNGLLYYRARIYANKIAFSSEKLAKKLLVQLFMPKRN